MAIFKSGNITITYSDNSGEVLAALKNAANRGLKVCGEKAVGFAQNDCPVDTGRLRGSISYSVEGEECYVGTNVNYAPYVEFGTGIYAETGGRQTPWAFKGKDGKWHKTKGNKPKPFIRPACQNHSSEYKQTMIDSFKNA